MGRSAATTGFSLDAEERAALDEFQDLVGVGSRTEALRRYFLVDLPRVNARLRALRRSGLEPSARPELDHVQVAEDHDAVERMYRSTWDTDAAVDPALAGHRRARRPPAGRAPAFH